MNLFTYGVFKKKETLLRVIGRPYAEVEYHPARMNHYRAVFTDTPNAPIAWWIAQPCYGHTMDGLVITGLNPSDFKHLDAFEGTGHGWYERSSVIATLTENIEVPHMDVEIYQTGSLANAVIAEDGL